MEISPQFLLRQAEVSDIPQIKEIMEAVFGPFAGLEKMFLKWMTNEQYSVRVALSQENIVGVCTWSLKTDDDYSKYESFGAMAQNFLSNRKSAWVVNLAVLPKYRKHGLGKKLALAHVDWLKKTNCDVVVGSSWVNGSEDNSQHLYLKSGFQKLGESKEFLRDQLKNGAECSVCKASDCNCNSIFFGIEAKKLIHFMEQL